MYYRVTLLTLLMISLLPVSVQAVPLLLTQQGQIFESDGSPLSGSEDVRFAIYTSETGGTLLWQETFSVTFDGGYYSVVLGNDTTLEPGNFDGSVRYLGIKLGTNDEMEPRSAITSVPYAIRAGWAEMATTPSQGGHIANKDYVDAGIADHNHDSLYYTQSQIDTALDLKSDADHDHGEIYYTKDEVDSLIGSGSSGDVYTKEEVDLLLAGQQEGEFLFRCPDGWIQIGEVCMDPTPNDTALRSVAVNTCFDLGARICGLDELMYACEHRDDLGVTMPSMTWIFIGGAGTHKMWSDYYAVGFDVYRRNNTKCYEDSQQTSETISWSWPDTLRNYYCCATPIPTPTRVYETCMQILEENSSAQSGKYMVDPDGAEGADPIEVWCDMDTDGGGWMVVHYDDQVHLRFPRGEASDSPGWSVDFLTSESPLQSFVITDYYFEVDNSWFHQFNDIVTYPAGNAVITDTLFGTHAAGWQCNSDSPGSTCHFTTQDDGRHWGIWTAPTSCCIGNGTGGLWYYSYQSGSGENYGICGNGWTQGDYSGSTTGCSGSSYYNASSPPGSTDFKVAIR